MALSARRLLLLNVAGPAAGGMTHPKPGRNARNITSSIYETNRRNRLVALRAISRDLALLEIVVIPHVGAGTTRKAPEMISKYQISI